jgi:hypothetical protein
MPSSLQHDEEKRGEEKEPQCLQKHGEIGDGSSTISLMTHPLLTRPLMTHRSLTTPLTQLRFWPDSMVKWVRLHGESDRKHGQIAQTN